MITLSHIDAGYDGKSVFNDFSLTFPSSGRVALMGESGSGKTTLLRLLAGLIKPENGTITGIENQKITFLFQEDRLLPWRSALENAALGSSKEKAAQWLKKLEIEDPSLLPSALSGGMQRRVALARALAFEGSILLMDEPFKGLDEELRSRVINLVRDAAPLIIFTTHDEQEAVEMGASVIRL